MAVKNSLYQDISEAWCYAMFRNYAQGTAWFDNFYLVINPYFNVENPSFETSGVGWVNYLSGFVYTNQKASHGTQSIKITGSGGARQVFSFPTG